jgi:hypothetical protein
VYLQCTVICIVENTDIGAKKHLAFEPNSYISGFILQTEPGGTSSIILGKAGLNRNAMRAQTTSIPPIQMFDIYDYRLKN